MRTKVVFLLMAVIFSAVICTGCIDPTLPVYEKTESDEDGICVVVGGVMYKQLPRIKWNVNKNEDIIGYAGNRDLSVSTIKGDTERNFIFLQGFWDEMYVLHREDIPEPSTENVDKLMWIEYVVSGNEEYTNTTVDKSVIEQLFNLMDTGEKTTGYNDIENDSGALNMYIACSSSQVPGASYDLCIGISNDGRLICGNRYENEYVEIPMELLEEIAGRQLDIRKAMPVFAQVDGHNYDVRGVIYSQLPYTGWKVNTDDGVRIGYAGFGDTFLMVCPGDTLRIFAFTKDRATGEINFPLYRRTDIDIPEVDAESVDKIVWEDNISRKTYTNIVKDKKVIKDLFYILNAGGADREYIDESPVTNISIKLYHFSLPFAYFSLNLGLHDNRIICEDISETDAAYLPYSLLEEIAGKNLKGILY